MDVDPGFSQTDSKPEGIKCQQCDKAFEDGKSLRIHKRKVHYSNIACHRFLEGTCDKSMEECEYKHERKETQNAKPEESSRESGFRFPPVDPFPTDQAQMIMQTLNMVLQKMDTMERFFQQMKQ